MVDAADWHDLAAAERHGGRQTLQTRSDPSRMPLDEIARSGIEPRGGMVRTTSRVAVRTRKVKRRADAMRFKATR